MMSTPEQDARVERVEHELQHYLDSAAFRRRHPAAYEKWSQAAAKLWSSDSEREWTSIGHLCREAVQEFAANLVEQFQPPGAPGDRQKTVARVRVTLDQQQARLASTEKPFLEALMTYWGAVNDLIQRQEHGGQREGNPLVWEDARRVVFQTVVVMYELDRSLA